MIGLPLLDVMTPWLKQARAGGAVAARRLVFFVFNGGTPETTMISTTEGRPGCLRPASTGPNFELTPLLQPLADLKPDIDVISNLHNNIGMAGVGRHAGRDHARMAMSLLTGVNPEDADSPNGRAGISVDQVAANALKAFTPALPSLYLGSSLDASVPPMSWAGPAAPLAPLINPSDAFRQVFGDPSVNAASLKKRLTYKMSVLHHAKEDIDRLRTRLGKVDVERLDRYLTGIGDLEKQISAVNAGNISACSKGAATDDTAALPGRIKQHLDLIALAFTCDRTRVATFTLMTHNLRMDWLGPPYSNYTNWDDDIEHGASAAQFGATDLETRMDTYVKGCTWIIEQFGYLARKLKQTPDGTGAGSLLDQSTLVCTSEMAYGNGHYTHHLPLIVAGRGGGAVNSGRHLAVPEQPIANLWVGMLNAAGIPVASFGNSTASLPLG